MRDTLKKIREGGLDLQEVAQELRWALSRRGQYLVLAEFVSAALEGCVIDPEALPPCEDAL